MASIYEFNPNVHENQLALEQRQVNQRIKLWLEGHGIDIDALGSGKGPSNADYLMATATFLGVLPNAKQFTVTPTPPLSFSTTTGVLTFGITPLANGGTNSSTSPSGISASVGFSNIAPPASEAGQMIVWDQTNTVWKRTGSLNEGGSTDYGFLMGSTTAVTGVAVRKLDTAYFDVNTGTGFVTTIGNLRSLNALTAATQTFAVGTTGSDFNISSVTSTHTFNLPTASATVRGALSSADWTTFNNKTTNAFTTIVCPAGSNPAADAAHDVLTLAVGSTRLTVTGSSAADSVTFDAVEANFTLNNIGGTLGVTKGGTGLTSLAEGDILYADAANSLTTLAFVGTATRFLANTGASSSPAWSQISLTAATNAVTGALPIANGGTGQITAILAFKALAPTASAAGTMIAYNAELGNARWVVVTGGATTKLLTYDESTSTDQPITWHTVGGDLTLDASAGATFTIGANKVTFAKFQTITTDRLLGRDTALTGVVEEIPVDTTLEFTGGPGLRRAALTGDVTAAAGSNATTIANDAVTFPKMRNAGANSVLVGAGSAGSGIDYTEITLGSGLTMAGTVLSSSMLASGYATMTDGSSPATASGADTFKFRVSNSVLSVVTTNNDATHGDNLLLTTSGAGFLEPMAIATPSFPAAGGMKVFTRLNGDNIELVSQGPLGGECILCVKPNVDAGAELPLNWVGEP